MPGTAPRRSCECHTRLNVCAESGLLAGSACPRTESHVFLRDATSDTEDAAAVAPTEWCYTHGQPWAWDTPEPEPYEAPEPEPYADPEPDKPSDIGIPQWVEELWRDFRRHIGWND